MDIDQMQRLNRDLGNLEGRLNSMEQQMQRNEQNVNRQLENLKADLKDHQREIKVDLESNKKEVKAQLEKNTDAIENISKSLSEFQNDIRDILSQGKGGWKFVTFIGSLVVGCAGFVAWIIEKVSM